MAYSWAQRIEELPVEMRLLLALLSRDGETGSLSEAYDSVWEQVDWDQFIELAMHHRVFPNLYPILKNGYKERVPEEVLRRCYELYSRNTLQMLYFTAEMSKLGRLLSDHGIRCLFLKGPVLAQDLYGEVSLRTSSDLDVLVPVEMLDQAEALLASSGYIKDEYIRSVLNDWKWRHHHYAYVHSATGLKVEVHWRLNPTPALDPRFDELWERKRVSTLSADPLYYLGREDLFFFLATHGARHGWSRVRWLLDIHKLLGQNPDPDRLTRTLKKYNVVSIGGQALALADRLLSSEMAPELRKLRDRPRSQKLAMEAMYYVERRINLHNKPLPEEVERYHKRHQFRLLAPGRKTFFTLSLLFPYPEDADTLPLPKRLHVLYIPLRPVLWLWRKTGGRGR
ncbi:nucleotidyltransferase domain-containing protein [Paenibacillus glufosinatiresistens]|uniref:nucleotidyltransferase domain-containing protein n=1 Tax=Paenibacillus glufosinatiresistens TaxID=3070657 RepID=UPI00286D81D9|nr:nucleotidyltransferase family protein [Paenibacillus sp. YX.27]